MKIGLDLVHIPQFKEKLQSVDMLTLFSEAEIKNQSVEHLAGIFAAKEAFFKALGKKDDWLGVWIDYSNAGKPILQSSLLKNENAEVSIAHDGQYAMAVVLIS